MPDLPASTYPELGLQACTFVPSLCRAKDQTQDSKQSGQALCPLSLTPAPKGLLIVIAIWGFLWVVPKSLTFK